MEKITQDQLYTLLEKIETDVLIQGKNENRIFISRCYIQYFNFKNLKDPKNGTVTFNYNVDYNETKRKCKNFTTLMNFLNRVGALQKGGISVIAIGGKQKSFKSFIDEYEKAQAFKSLDMQGLIKKYGSLADSFEIVTPFSPYETYTEENPNGIFRLSKEDGERAITLLDKEIKEILLSLYDKLPKVQKNQLPDFPVLCENIKVEILTHMCKNKKELAKTDESPFLCDNIHKGKTQYAKPHKFFWHMYHSLQFLVECIQSVEAMKLNSKERHLDLELNDEKNSVLKPYLISVTPTFTWHCTTQNFLSLVFRFRLTEETKKWLLQFDTDYDIDPFEDLAFYKGNTLLFSSCTHEGYHKDFT